MRDDLDIMGGRFLKNASGALLGVSYFSVYRQEALKEVMTASGLSFAKARWHELSESHQAWLSERDMRKQLYDTGKLINLRMQERTALTYLELPLVHIGAISGWAWQNQSRLHRLLRPLVNRLPIPVQSLIRRLRVSPYKVLTADEQHELAQLTLRRQAAQKFLRHLAGNDPENAARAIRHLPEETRNKIELLGRKVVEIRRSYPCVSPGEVT